MPAFNGNARAEKLLSSLKYEFSMFTLYSYLNQSTCWENGQKEKYIFYKGEGEKLFLIIFGLGFYIAFKLIILGCEIVVLDISWNMLKNFIRQETQLIININIMVDQ